jgi:nucleoid-associated protein Lsr2
MTQRTVVTLEDDLTGGEADETVSFALDGKGYEIDLSADNAAGLRELLAPYVSVARRAGRINVPAARRGSPLRHVATDVDPAAVRAWAASNGYEVSPRGRISRAVQDAFKAAMG